MQNKNEITKLLNKINTHYNKATQEALDRCDNSEKGMSVEEFLKELDSW